MATPFKVGDMVRLVDVPRGRNALDLRVGMVGAITKYDAHGTLFLSVLAATLIPVWTVDFGSGLVDVPVPEIAMRKIAGDGDISGDETETDKPTVNEFA